MKAIRQIVHRAICKLLPDYAYEALLSEVMLTPKPGLVDRRNSGAHRDMDIDTSLKSARVLAKYFPFVVQIGCDAASVEAGEFLLQARSIGLECEEEMFEATRGINTHKGAIFRARLVMLCRRTAGRERDRTDSGAALRRSRGNLRRPGQSRAR